MYFVVSRRPPVGEAGDIVTNSSVRKFVSVYNNFEAGIRALRALLLYMYNDVV